MCIFDVEFILYIMSILRFSALQETLHRKPIHIEEKGRRSELFGENVFNEQAMRQYMT